MNYYTVYQIYICYTIILKKKGEKNGQPAHMLVRIGKYV